MPLAMADPADYDKEAELSALQTEFPADEALQPNQSQQQILDSLLEAAPGLYVLIEGPGCGKTFMTKLLASKAAHAGRAVVLSATTGAAAVRLSRQATTVNAAFGIRCRGTGTAL